MKTYLSRTEALTRYPLTETELDRLLAEGKVNTASLVCHDGPQLIFYDDDLAAYVAERDITPAKFDHLRGHLMGIGEAAREYKLSQVTISQWVQQGRLEIKREEGQKKFVDEADVAYLAALGRAKKMRPGKKVF
jgi:hypothetical protein